jgi:hypothetical protein
MGQERRICAVRISALPRRADVGADIVEPPLSAITGRTAAFRHYLFDHLVGAGEQHRRHDEAERLGFFEGAIAWMGLTGEIVTSKPACFRNNAGRL